MKKMLFLIPLLLAACETQTLAQYEPVVDRPNAQYTSDLAQCRAIATQAEAKYKKQRDAELGANMMAGLLVGAVAGAAIGDTSNWAAYGAATGAASGAAATDTEQAYGGPRRIIDRCMAGRGHRILSDLGKG